MPQSNNRPPSKSSLQPTDRLQHRDQSQWTELPGNRLLVRHAGGVTVLRDINRTDAEAVLAEVDGRRSAEEVVDALAPRYSTRRAMQLLRRLFGEVVHRVPVQLEGYVKLIVNSHDAIRLQTLLEDRGLGQGAVSLCSSYEPTGDDGFNAHVLDGLDSSTLAVVALEKWSYQDLLKIQARFLRTGVTSLFLTHDADGVRVGPTVLPGKTACLACAQRTHFSFLEGDALFSESVFDGLKTLTASPTSPHRSNSALVAVADEIRRLLSKEGEPALLSRVLRFSPRGQTTIDVTPGDNCPLDCQSAPATRSFDVQADFEHLHTERSGSPIAGRADSEDLVRSIGILGGGTAGYLTALALRRKHPNLRVTLIESSSVPVIGVGEATTPLMPQFLHADLGLDIHELFHQVKPTFKLGIRFHWGACQQGTGQRGTGQRGTFNYPFGAVRPLESYLYDGHVQNCSLRSMMMARGLVPIWRESAGKGNGKLVSRLDTEVAYHLDNARFVGYLREQARRAGVEHLDATITEATRSTDGENVTALLTGDGRQFTFDLYVDCSGFRSLLMGKALNSPFESFAKDLFTDQAWVTRVGHGPSGDVKPYTLATAMSSGWCWSTPQAHEDHLGYVFCSALQSPDAALAEMRASGLSPDSLSSDSLSSDSLSSESASLGEPHLIRFRAGRHQHFWQGNVVALGNAYGFVEPLESTALHMLIRQIGLLVRAFPLRRGERGLENLLNRQVGDTWDYLRWFLSLHYKFNQALDSPFWRACRDEIDVSRHGELLEAFAERGPLSYDPASRLAFDYPDPLWGPEGIDMILMGQGAEARWPRPTTSQQAWTRQLALAEGVLRRCLPQQQALELLDQTPALLERMAATFRAAGPAFPVMGTVR